MNAPHKLLDNKEFSIMLPKVTNKKALLDSIATLKSSYVTFHSKLLQRSQSYEELSSSSRLQEPKKDKNQSNGNINANEMIAETRSLNEKSAQPNVQKASIKTPEGPNKENGSIIKEERKSGGELLEKEVSVLIQNSGLIKREISMINQDETLKNFIDELEFSQKESTHNDDQEPSSEDSKPKIGESRKSNNNSTSSLKSSAKENSKEISVISVESKRSLQSKEESLEKPFWGRVNKLSIVINVLLISLFFMAQKVKFSQIFEVNQKELLADEIILQEKLLMERNNETVITVEVVKDVKEYREYQELKELKEKLENENRALKFKTEVLVKRVAELNDNFEALNSTYTKTLEKIGSVKDKLEQGKEKMEKVKDNNVAVICSRYLGVIGTQLFGEN